jgi:hypothetical protein
MPPQPMQQSQEAFAVAQVRQRTMVVDFDFSFGLPPRGAPHGFGPPGFRGGVAFRRLVSLPRAHHYLPREPVAPFTYLGRLGGPGARFRFS